MREATYPRGFPDSWYRLAASSDLAAGQIKYVECLGKQIVVYRSEDGRSVSAMSAFCPHLGANLSGGCVKGERLECPFHHWQLCSDGRVGKIPYADKLPARARQETWPIREVYGQIFIYHRGGQFNDCEQAPPYEIPAIPEVDDGRWAYRGRHDGKTVRMHLIEFAENSVDFAHFAPIHSGMFVPWTAIKVPGVKVEHEADWEPDADQPHLAYFKNKAVLHVLGRLVERTRASALITFVGPGSVVTFRFKIPDVGEIIMFQTHLPISAMEQKVDFLWYADKTMPRMLVSYVVGNWVSQWAADIDIWENKVYLDKPTLAAGDGPIHRMRRWYKQFYSADDATDDPTDNPTDLAPAVLASA
ncbi:Rieske 2Fe-2S domain-containing protein [Enhygromyxa salina]|uniref:cholesterol 7-desaturase n=1 Tax=Enhygromyxa salina TaxID=215803 RepID=A0A2S9YTZ4_9BACT|nr:Rieske 2Fe-2S domain-containing protein [Enhygromyxa salina]PRQ08563.1 3-ketosteroid-9-alpha-monooxygenase oxygenase subunit [Enhygromyxa salina]